VICVLIVKVHIAVGDYELADEAFAVMDHPRFATLTANDEAYRKAYMLLRPFLDMLQVCNCCCTSTSHQACRERSLPNIQGRFEDALIGFAKVVQQQAEGAASEVRHPIPHRVAVANTDDMQRNRPATWIHFCRIG